ncbi:hypothetical protein FACS1894141_4720 [Spirochaetia bacterium]|nr:hypothetical protein FACS1894141_4720 [Spirochaetia bacterium]
MFWTWLGYRDDFEESCKSMQELGIGGVVLNAPNADDYRTAVAIAGKYGIDVHAWTVTMMVEEAHGRAELLREHPDWFSVNRLGQSLVHTKAYVDYYRFLCPAIRDVRERIKARIRTYCEVDGLKGISLDYHRFVDVILPTTLWGNYGVVQDREYPQYDYGYHPAMIAGFKEKHGYDPRDQEDPSDDEKWLQFRCDEITEVANEIAEVVHSYGKLMSASPFPTPKMSRQMVRQDWGTWDLDLVFPMIYHQFYTEDVSFIGDCTRENLRDKNKKTTLFSGLMMDDSPKVADYLDQAIQNGAEGVSIFTMDSIKSPETRKAFRAYTEKARAGRPTVQPAIKPAVVEVNPFNKPGVMDLIHRKMRENTKGGELKLGEYTLISERKAAKRYRVTDAASNTTFNVDFYFYGGILSGWMVAAAT